ncbi:MAG: SDR family NAD(P)-dependent oxidoreductase [Phycisphaerae bacterium]|nr:SDR family NAD(P)-dependent oxidoreductase [Phycisphaerae bacterium]
MRIDGSVIVLTGASRGIGRCLAVEFARRGGVLVLVARQSEALTEALSAVRESSPDSIAIPTDVTQREAVESMVAEAFGRFGRVDVLVNNAGRGHFGPFLEVAPDALDAAMKVNFWGAVYCMRAVVPHMFERRRGVILNMGAVDGKFGIAGGTVGCSSKFAIVGLSEALHLELRPRGVKVLLFNPGPVDTEAFREEWAGAPARWGTMSPERVSRAIVRSIERERPEVTLPRMLGLAVRLRHLAPSVFRWFVARAVPASAWGEADRSLRRG